MNPNNWLIVFAFIAIATASSAIYGWFVKQEKLPFRANMDYSDAQFRFMKVWVKIALVLGVIIPVVLWLVFWNQPMIRKFFSCYLLVVAVQLASESSFSRIFCPSVVVIIGTLFTGFRIWQLWSGLHLTVYPMPWLGLFWLVFLFWVANMIMLISMPIPKILPNSNIALGARE